MINVFKLSILIILFARVVLSADNSLEKVSLQLNWKHQFEFAGFYMAKEKGFYKEIGLDVELREIDTDIKHVADSVNRDATYAVGYSSALIDASNGAEIKFLCAIFQSSPLVMLTTKKSNIKTIKEFKNKRIMSSGDLLHNAPVISMMHSQGIDIKDVIIQEPSFDIKDLLNGKTDLMPAFISNEPFVLQELGAEPVIFHPKEYGFDFYDNILITSSKHLEQNPQQVKKFTEASLKGWEYAFAHIDESVELILKKYNTQGKSKKALIYEANELKKLAYFQTSKIGAIEKEKFEKSYQVYKLLGLTTSNLDFETLIYDRSEEILQLTQEEQEYLKNKKQINLCIDPNWMPFEMFDENGVHVGMTADYFNLIEEDIGIEINSIETGTWSESVELAKNRECDVLSLLIKTPQREAYLSFTRPYIELPLVIATKTDVAFTDDFSAFKGKKVGIPKGYATIDLLKKKYPYLEIVEVQNIDDGLRRVNNGELDAFAGTIATVGYKIQSGYVSELKITGKFDEEWKGSIGVRNDEPLLLSILEKSIQKIGVKQKQEILNNWVSVKYEKSVDYGIVWKALPVVVLFLLFFFYRQYLLKKTNKELKLLASTDSLTKLHNRRYFTTTSEYIFQMALREKKSISILMLDIDFFKNINDNYGHKIGDEVIESLASILTQETRKSDIVSRWGGEEFVILIADTTKQGAMKIAEKIREVVATTSVKVDDDRSVTFTISIGVAELNHKTDKEIDTLIVRADGAMYSAKAAGRNRVCIS